MPKSWIYIGSTPVEFPPNITVEKGQALPYYATEEQIAKLKEQNLLVEAGDEPVAPIADAPVVSAFDPPPSFKKHEGK